MCDVAAVDAPPPSPLLSSSSESIEYPRAVSSFSSPPPPLHAITSTSLAEECPLKTLSLVDPEERSAAAAGDSDSENRPAEKRSRRRSVGRKVEEKEVKAGGDVVAPTRPQRRKSITPTAAQEKREKEKETRDDSKSSRGKAVKRSSPSDSDILLAFDVGAPAVCGKSAMRRDKRVERGEPITPDPRSSRPRRPLIKMNALVSVKLISPRHGANPRAPSVSVDAETPMEIAKETKLRRGRMLPMVWSDDHYTQPEDPTCLFPGGSPSHVYTTRLRTADFKNPYQIVPPKLPVRQKKAKPVTVDGGGEGGVVKSPSDTNLDEEREESAEREEHPQSDQLQLQPPPSGGRSRKRNSLYPLAARTLQMEEEEGEESEQPPPPPENRRVTRSASAKRGATASKSSESLVGSVGGEGGGGGGEVDVGQMAATRRARRSSIFLPRPVLMREEEEKEKEEQQPERKERRKSLGGRRRSGVLPTPVLALEKEEREEREKREEEADAEMSSASSAMSAVAAQAVDRKARRRSGFFDLPKLTTTVVEEEKEKEGEEGVAGTQKASEFVEFAMPALSQKERRKSGRRSVFLPTPSLLSLSDSRDGIEAEKDAAPSGRRKSHRLLVAPLQIKVDKEEEMKEKEEDEPSTEPEQYNPSYQLASSISDQLSASEGGRRGIEPLDVGEEKEGEQEKVVEKVEEEEDYQTDPSLANDEPMILEDPPSPPPSLSDVPDETVKQLEKRIRDWIRKTPTPPPDETEQQRREENAQALRCAHENNKETFQMVRYSTPPVDMDDTRETADLIEDDVNEEL